MRISKDQIIFVKKHELPMPLVVEDEHGNFEIQELAPAGAKRLGARVGQIHEQFKKMVIKVMRRS
jgi:hypothetical protein